MNDQENGGQCKFGSACSQCAVFLCTHLPFECYLHHPSHAICGQCSPRSDYATTQLRSLTREQNYPMASQCNTFFVDKLHDIWHIIIQQSEYEFH